MKPGPFYVLGLNACMHDSAVCLLRDGEIVGFAEEERFVRRKHTGELPEQALRFVLDEAGIAMADVDQVAFFWRPWKGLARRVLITATGGGFRPRISRDRPSIFRSMTRVPGRLRGMGFRGRFRFVDHHAAHMASAFCPSGFDEAAILVIDANGEGTTTLAARARGHTYHEIGRIPYPHSLGLLYLCATEYLGFRENSGEGKVMGLASYGTPRFTEDFEEILRIGPGFEMKLDMRYFDVHLGKKDYVTRRFIERFGPRRLPDEEFSQHHLDVAASVQAHTGATVLHLARELHRRTGARKLCMAGGVALNSVANGQLAREGPFDEIYIQPAAHDAGAAMGAALLVHHFLEGRPGTAAVSSAALGPMFDERAIGEALARSGPGLDITEPIDRYAAAADDVARGQVIGWFQGRMEVGPRALGFRSILADPRDPKMKDRVNERVKHREGFRPFAPAVLEHRAGDYFEAPVASPDMLFVFPVREDRRDLLPAVTHVDGTARLQTVTEDSSPHLWSFLQAFDERTGIPVVLNTSFNVRGEPIVCTPDDAIQCFLGTDLDVLYLEGRRITKTGSSS